MDKWQPLRDELLLGAHYDVRLMDHPLIKARVVVNFGVFKVKGFTVREKDGKTWVMPPSVATRHSRTGHSVLFFCEDLFWWKSLEKAIINAVGRKRDDLEVAQGRRKHIA